jgi:hypothetical protein
MPFGRSSCARLSTAMRLLSCVPMGGGLMAKKPNELRAVNVVAS